MKRPHNEQFILFLDLYISKKRKNFSSDIRDFAFLVLVQSLELERLDYFPQAFSFREDAFFLKSKTKSASEAVFRRINF